MRSLRVAFCLPCGISCLNSEVGPRKVSCAKLAQIPLSVWESGYNKDEELDADREGIRLAFLDGYSPYGAVTLFQKLAKLQKEYLIHAQSPEEELSELAIQSLKGYFRSHPQPAERLAQANILIAQANWPQHKAQRPFRI